MANEANEMFERLSRELNLSASEMKSSCERGDTDALLKNVWGFPTEADTRSVDMCIRRLRVKIGSGVIRTIYGRGYILME